MSQSTDSTNIAIRYDQSTVTHTTQFILSANSEAVVIDCSSGPIPGHTSDEQVLPIHSRHALPWSAVRRLSGSLRQMLDKHDRQVNAPAPKFIERQAGLPRIEGAHVK